MSRHARLTILELGAPGTAWASASGQTPNADDWVVVAQQSDEADADFTRRVRLRAQRLRKEDAQIDAIDVYAAASAGYPHRSVARPSGHRGAGSADGSGGATDCVVTLERPTRRRGAHHYFGTIRVYFGRATNRRESPSVRARGTVRRTARPPHAAPRARLRTRRVRLGPLANSGPPGEVDRARRRQAGLRVASARPFAPIDVPGGRQPEGWLPRGNLRAGFRAATITAGEDKKNRVLGREDTTKVFSSSRSDPRPSSLPLSSTGPETLDL